MTDAEVIWRMVLPVLLVSAAVAGTGVDIWMRRWWKRWGEDE